MRTTRCLNRILRRGLLMIPLLLAGCASAGAGEPRAWIDMPHDGAEVEVGREIAVLSHVYAREGVAQVELSINGTAYRREPPGEPGAAFGSISQAWTPESAGDFTLGVVAYDAGGRVSRMASVRVRAVMATTITVMPTFTPTPTSTPTPTISPTPPPFRVNIWADRLDLQPGQCTTLHWEIDQATAVTLDGSSVAAYGSRQVCPAVSTMYRFHITGPGGGIDRELLITVAGPSDTTPPAISGVTPSATLIYVPNCQPNTAVISANVSDASGVARVELSYRVLEGSRQGVWRTLTMSPAGGSRYQATLDWTALDSSLHPPVTTGATIQYLIRAQDVGGNAVQSSTFTITYEECII
ncbi:MAG: hypothetical protein A2Z66_12130 [Chloroflexi bacterium RBG_13_66_10]|nr:MAG: hypothetical protein A2Z66_12130 [Chloroflexi bacterium RBG_13_66_10]